ncbi:MAG TPA: GvpL/GvpF family gas vesicle protein [Thermoanaerobaculia bacterium]|nr:GvpL/GvpF family gas vesicle protein [Thermoanaerobaculia bacterium]
MSQVLYVYAIARASHPLPERVEAIDGSDHIGSVPAGRLCAFYSAVDAADFSQPVIDARSKDVEWLGAIGYRHQAVMNALMRGGTVIPLRAFTLFANESSLRAHVLQDEAKFESILERLDGKQEWTLRIEFDPEPWNEAIVRRVESLRAIDEESQRAAPGKAYLLRKKLEEEKKRASREAEEQVVREVGEEVMRALACDTVSESRVERGGAFPQINVLLDRDEESRLQGLRDDLNRRYGSDGVTLALTGPWPPYSFAGRMKDEGRRMKDEG